MLSNKDVKFYITANITNEDSESNVARKALISIAQELQRFQHETEISQHNTNNTNEIFDKLNIYSKKMKLKNKKLRKLKGNLKIACNVAKMIISSKDRETNLIVNHLNIIRDESANLQKNQTEHIVFIEKLQADKDMVYNELQRINGFIHLGYHEVQKLRSKLPKDIPHIMELSEILLACGQYYADYCNERERCAQLEQRNRFLKNKLSILENNLAATTEDLRNLRNQNVRLTRTLVAKHNVEGETHLQVDKFGLTPRSVNDNCPQVMVNKSQHYVVSHLKTVSSLLFDQDNILQDLKKISEELYSLEAAASQSGSLS